MQNILKQTIEKLESDRVIYVTKTGHVCMLQRLAYDGLWYAVVDGQIVNYSGFRCDLEEWLDKAISDESLKELYTEKQ